MRNAIIATVIGGFFWAWLVMFAIAPFVPIGYLACLPFGYFLSVIVGALARA